MPDEMERDPAPNEHPRPVIQPSITEEFRSLMADRWATMPDATRTDTQIAGIGGVACGATHGVLERCNYACTSCYLSSIANATPALPFEEVRAQLDALRAHLGPAGKAQITAGEVTLLPLEDLGRIVAYAVSIGLDPMVMTNGSRFDSEPGYLEALVRDYGLRKVSIHVDTTQRGRDGLSPEMTETDLHPVRARYADMIRAVRRSTGLPLHAAHTVTVTPDNAAEVPSIVDWVSRNADAFRMLSLQPVAEVGRTQDRSDDGMDLDAVWEHMCEPFGRRLNRDAMSFGHRECNITVPVLLLDSGRSRRIFELVREGSAADARAVGSAMRAVADRIDLTKSGLRSAATVIGTILRRPRTALRLLSYGLRRGWSDRGTIGSLVWRSATLRPPRLRPLMLVVHSFMDENELDTPLGRERLDACVFKLPVDGAMVSMCELNASGLRRSLNERSIERASSR